MPPREAVTRKPVTRESAKSEAAPVKATAEFPADALVLPSVPPQNALKETHRCELRDARIDECSGLAASRRFVDCVWTHNDSGDQARVFLIGTRGAKCGKTLATVGLKGAHASDWEDIATVGTGKSAFVYAGDIGDNLKSRDSIQIHRFAEAALPAVARVRDMSTHAADKASDSSRNSEMEITLPSQHMTLRYPDGAHDAETLVALPDNRLIVVTKDIKGSLIFITPRAFASDATQTLERIGALRFESGSFFGRLVTGGDLSPDGARLILRTYTDAFEWRLPPRFFNIASWSATKAKWREVWRQSPRAWVLPQTRQGEAICYDWDARRLWISSEKMPVPLIELTH